MNINSNLNVYKKPILVQNNKYFAFNQAFNNRKLQNYNSIDINFTARINKTDLPNKILNKNGDFYSIKLFNKIKNKYEKAILGDHAPLKYYGKIDNDEVFGESERAFVIYSAKGNELGRVNINFIENKNYARLHYLEKTS